MNEELKVVIKAELAQFRTALNEAIGSLKKVGDESRRASKEMDGFTAEVNQQAKALTALKQDYINLAAAHGKESKEAKDAAEQISKLSKEYATNRVKLKALADDANKLDYSMNDNPLDQSEGVENTNTSMKELAKTLQTIKGMSFAEMVLEFLQVLPQLKTGFTEAWNGIREGLEYNMKYMKDMFAQLYYTLNPFKYSQEYGEDYTFKKSMEGAKFALGEIGNTAKDTASYVKDGLGGALKSAAGKTDDVAVAAGGATAATAGLSAATLGWTAVIALAIAQIMMYIAAIALLITGMVKLVKNAITVSKHIKELTTTASKIGLTTDQYVEWAYVLKQVGVEADKLSDFLKTLSDEQNAVRDGDEEKTKAFARLGMSAEEVGSMTQLELFEATVSALQNIENSTERASLAYRIFGEDAAELSNVLYLSNEETRSMANNLYALGAAPSDRLVAMSKEMSFHTTNLSYAWEGIKNTLAELVLPLIIKITSWLVKAVAIVNMFIRTIFNLAPSTKEASKGFGGLSSGVNSYTESLDDANDAAKELLKTTFGFDELNIMAKQPSGSSGGSGTTGGSGNAFGGGGFDTGSLTDFDMSGITEWFDKYRGIIQGVVQFGLMGIGTLMVLFGLATWNPVMAVVGLGLAGFGFSLAFKQGKFDGIINGVKDAVNKLKEKISGFITYVSPLFTKAYWAEKWNQVKAALEEKMTEISTKLSEKWNVIKEWFNTNVAPKFTKDYWKTKFENIKTALSEKLDETKQKASEKWNAIKDWYNANVAPKFTKEYWKTKFEAIRAGASEKLDEVKSKISEKWNGIKQWFNSTVKPVFTTTYWANKFETIKSGAKSAFNGLIGIVESAINKIIRNINTLSWKVPDWVPKIGGKSWGFNFNTISIPRLATGGIATSSILANIGENGREAVLPLDRNTGWMDTLADRIAARNNTPSRIVLMVDGRELGHATINSINGITQQTGQLQLALY